MSNSTKADLEASLKKFLLKKTFDKITIHDLTNDCGISRMSFYYHFKDIYDLVAWCCEEDGKRALQGKKTYQTWQEGFLQIFEVILENKPFILNIYHSVSREQIETYLYQLTYGLLEGVIKEQAQGTAISKEDMQFIAEFYKYSFVGILLDWVKEGMKEEPAQIVEKVSITLNGNIANSVENFSNQH
ncbi:MAG: hypothetical protein PWP24_344 [Clostridiales bacterium]|nr:hypothetical protein [Clostridiales bacterium]